MCAANKKASDDNKEQHKDITDRINEIDKNSRDDLAALAALRLTRTLQCEQMFDQRPRMSLFMWIVGGIFACMIFLGGMLIDIDTELETHIKRSKAVYHELTGDDYDTTHPEKK